MNGLRITLLALSLGPLAASARAGDWTAPASHPVPAAAAQIGRPVAVPAPAALLDRPRAVGDGAPPASTMTDPQLRPALFGPVIRGQAPDAKPLPSGPTAAGDPLPPPRDWQRPAPEPISVASPAMPGTTIVPGPIVGPGPIVEQGSEPAAPECDCWWHFPLWTWLRHDTCCSCDASCAPACDAGCDACEDSSCDNTRFYAWGEYLLWWTKGDQLPPLVTAASLGDFRTPGVFAGALDRPGSQVLFGGTDANDRSRSGGRFMVGYWFGEEHALGVEGGGFFLGRQTTDFNAFSGGSPILARPFFDVTRGRQSAEFVAEPGRPGIQPTAGTINASDSTSFWGAEANVRTNLCCGCDYNVDLLAGWRHYGLDDNLTVTEAFEAFGPGGPDFAFVGVDQFKAQNRFNGGQVGFDGQFRYNRWSVDARAVVAIGNTSERVIVQGSNSQNGVVSAGDLLTVPGSALSAGNIGSFHRNRFAWSPEANLKLGYQITDHMRAFVGYDFLYLSKVVRAGDQVNLAADPTHLGGGATTAAQPPFAFHDSDFWAQGVNFGLEFRY